MKLPSRAVLLALLLASTPAIARTYKVPPDHPALSVTVPNDWRIEPGDHGYTATSPGKDVILSIDYAGSQKLASAMAGNHATWLEQNHIQAVSPTQEDGNVNGVPMTHYQFDTTDNDGPTLVDVYLLKPRVAPVMLTIWGSAEERSRHERDLVSIMRSVKSR